MNLTVRWAYRLIAQELIWIGVLAATGMAIALLPLSVALALVCGVSLTALTLVKPEYGVYVLIFAIPFGSLWQFQLSGVNVDVSEACVAVVIVSWLVSMVARRSVVVPHLPLALPLIGFVAVLALSWLSALSLAVSVKETLKWIQVLLLYLFIGSTFDTAQVRRTIGLTLAAGSLSALLGSYQFFGRAGPDGFLWHTPVGLFMRAYGTFEQPNPFGGYLGLIAPLAYGLWLTSFVQSKYPASWTEPLALSKHATAVMASIWRVLTKTTLYAAITAFLVLAIVMTWSRGAILGFASAFVAINMLRSRQMAIAFLALTLLLVGLGALQLLPDVVMQRFLDFLPFLSIPDVSAVEVDPVNFAIVQRLAHWTAGWKMFEAHPWNGIGIGNYGVVYPLYAPPAWPDSMGHAHNYYLNIAAEAGLIGLAAYLLLWAAIFRQVWRAYRCLSGYALGVAIGVFGVLVHLSVHNLVDNLYVHGMYLHIAILLGCLTALLPRRVR